MIRVFAVAIVILGLMLAVKDGRILRKAGLTGGCTTVAAPATQDGEWRACKPGKLQGAPDLTRQGCTSQSVVGKIEYWHCPASIASGQGT